MTSRQDSLRGRAGIKDRMHHDKLIEWVKSRRFRSAIVACISPCWECGKPEDLAVLEGMIQSKDRQNQRRARCLGGRLI